MFHIKIFSSIITVVKQTRSLAGSGKVKSCNLSRMQFSHSFNVLGSVIPLLKKLS